MLFVLFSRSLCVRYIRILFLVKSIHPFTDPSFSIDFQRKRCEGLDFQAFTLVPLQVLRGGIAVNAW